MVSIKCEAKLSHNPSDALHEIVRFTEKIGEAQIRLPVQSKELVTAAQLKIFIENSKENVAFH